MLKDKDEAQARLIRLEHGQPIRFGADGSKGVVRAADGTMDVVDVASVGEESLLVHDAENPNPATSSPSPGWTRRPCRTSRSGCSGR